MRVKWFVGRDGDTLNPFGLVDLRAATLYGCQDGFTQPTFGPADPDERARENRAIWEAAPAPAPPGLLVGRLHGWTTRCGPLEVPAGTPLPLAAGDWTGGRDLTPDTNVVVVLSAVRPDDDGEWTWVIGHWLQCEYTTDEHLPCLELRVRTTALVAYGALA